MNKYKDLYGVFKQAQEAKQKRNFNAFMTGLESGLVEDLDKHYRLGKTDPAEKQQYDALVTRIKGMNMRIFRNSDGKHKLDFVKKSYEPFGG